MKAQRDAYEDFLEELVSFFRGINWRHPWRALSINWPCLLVFSIVYWFAQLIDWLVSQP